VAETAGFQANRGLGPQLFRRTSLSSHQPASGSGPVQRTSVCLFAKEKMIRPL
jgi:hypothetical protein